MEAKTRIVSPDVLRGGSKERTPPGQTLTAKWPVLHYGSVPKVDPRSDNWSLRIFGLVENEFELSYDEIRALPLDAKVKDDMLGRTAARLLNIQA